MSQNMTAMQVQWQKDNHNNKMAGTSGGAAEAVAERMTLKYIQLSQRYTFIPVAVETMGPMNSAGLKFVSDIGRRITQVSKDSRKSAFLFQRLSVLIQRFNSVAIRGTFAHTPTEEEL